MPVWSGSSRVAHQGLLAQRETRGLQAGTAGSWLVVGCCQGAGGSSAVRHSSAAHSKTAQSSIPLQRGRTGRRGFKEWNQQHRPLGILGKFPFLTAEIQAPPAGLPAGPPQRDVGPEPCRPARGRRCRNRGGMPAEAAGQADDGSSRGIPPEFANRHGWARSCVQASDQRAGKRNSAESIRDGAPPFLAPLRLPKLPCPGPAPSPSVHELVHAPFGDGWANRVCGSWTSCSPPAVRFWWMGEPAGLKGLAGWPPNPDFPSCQRPALAAAAMYRQYLALAAAGDRAARTLLATPGDQQQPIWLAKGIPPPHRTSCMSSYVHTGPVRLRLLDQMHA